MDHQTKSYEDSLKRLIDRNKLEGQDIPFQKAVPKLRHDPIQEAAVDKEGSPNNNRGIMSSLFHEFMEALKSENDFKKFLNHARNQMKEQ